MELSFLLAAAIGGFLLPLLALLRARSTSRPNRLVDWTYSALALVCLLFWAGMAYSNPPTQSGILIFLLPLSMMSGCLFAMIVFLVHGWPVLPTFGKRIRRSSS